MAASPKQRLCQGILVVAPIVFLGAAVGMLLQYEPFFSWFYCFAWWPYILFSEAWLYHRGGTSLLFSAPGRFLELLPWSVNIWLVFEVFNFRLHNWGYVGVPATLGARWLGYTISFATVLPALFTTLALLDHAGLIKPKTASALSRPHQWYLPMVFVGLASLLLPMIWPKYFFPLVWGAFVFLLEPLNHHLHGDSLLLAWTPSARRRFLLLLLAGACCGLLWEFWNFWAGSKWVYTIPYVHFFRIFEMPILGFLGFPPFALECYVMVAMIRLARGKLRERITRGRSGLARLVLITLVSVLDCWVFLEIDHWTVISYRG